MEVIVITALSTFNRHAYGAYPAFAAKKKIKLILLILIYSQDFKIPGMFL